MPRFGLEPFLRQWPVAESFRLRVDGDVEQALELTLEEIVGASRRELVADFHCVATWTVRDLAWSGRSLASVWEEVVVPRARPLPGVAHMRARGLDGFMASLPLEDALAPDAFLADRLAGAPLPMAHGAPLRLVLPAHYGYKNLKHLTRLEFTIRPMRGTGGRFLVHPRGRVAFEERNEAGPQIAWRWIYRALKPIFLAQARRTDSRARQTAR